MSKLRRRSRAPRRCLALTLLVLPHLAACPAPRPTTPPAGPVPRTVLGLATHLCLHPDASWRGLFAPALRDRGLVERVRGAFRQLRRLHGPCRAVKHRGGPRVVYELVSTDTQTPKGPPRTSRVLVPGTLHLDANQRIDGIWFRPAVVPGDTWARLVRDLRALPGQTALTALTIRNGRQVRLAGQQSKKALAVGSAFKLYLLKALRQEIHDGRMRWDDVVLLDPKQRSFPSAPLNRWPAHAPLTLQTVATWMIARSDNTATDLLLHHLGRALVERHAGTWNRPFLSTREMFVLKSPGLESLAKRYLAAPLAGRRALLAEIARVPRREVRPDWRRPRYVDRLEWFFSTDALCRVMLPLKDLPVFRVSSGPASPRRWRRIAYKGGSEPGVRNVTLALQHRRTGRWACLSLTWNRTDARLDLPRFRFLVARALRLLAQ